MKKWIIRYGIWFGFIIVLNVLLWSVIDLFYDINRIGDLLRFVLMIITASIVSMIYLFVIKDKVEKKLELG